MPAMLVSPEQRRSCGGWRHQARRSLSDVERRKTCNPLERIVAAGKQIWKGMPAEWSASNRKSSATHFHARHKQGHREKSEGQKGAQLGPCHGER
ncbi:hypothetical protein EYF80_004543 [Liparis tanakae]|uniref:Uncharacterized protein n=1 Tax=Liparis tanakae TaxID=230148 RepID=A0A4Z2J6L8_9TELE|nr:hypothetical protein EYF80_004543 [Liparis tanakae]